MIHVGFAIVHTYSFRVEKLMLLLLCSSVFCVNGQLRLVNGTTKLDGRLEICYNETWGTICDNFWSVEDANVACKQLGFQPNGAIAVTNAGFGMGTGPIWLDDLICFGMEAELINCIHGGVGAVDFCNGHADDAGLICLEGICLQAL